MAVQAAFPVARTAILVGDHALSDRLLESQFDGRIERVGWRAVSDPANAGTLLVDVGWRALDRSSSDYAAFVHLIDDQRQILGQHDQPPGGPDNPTHLWVPGETLRTTFVLTPPSGVNLDELRLRIGLYEPVGGCQLPVTGTQEQREADQGETFVVVPAHTPWENSVDLGQPSKPIKPASFSVGTDKGFDLSSVVTDAVPGVSGSYSPAFAIMGTGRYHEAQTCTGGSC